MVRVMRPSKALSVKTLRGIDFCNDCEKFSPGGLKIEPGFRVV